MVYKPVDIEGKAQVKLPEDLNKVTIPGCNCVYRLIGNNGKPILDVMNGYAEPPPQVGQRMLYRHPF